MSKTNFLKILLILQTIILYANNNYSNIVSYKMHDDILFIKDNFVGKNKTLLLEDIEKEVWYRL